MPYRIEYDRVAKIISIKRVRDPGIVLYKVIFKVGKRKFKAYLGNNLSEDTIQEAIKRNYEQQTRDLKTREYRDSLPGSKIHFKTEVE